jgi:hypothetical protein
MKKLLKFILILILIAMAAYVAYRYYLPSTIAESLTSGSQSALIPDEIQEKIEELKFKTSNDVGDLPELMVEANINYLDLQTMLNRLDPKDVSEALLEMSSVNITSTEQAFDILVKHIDIEGYQLETFRGMFVRNNNADEIQEAMSKVKGYEYLISMSMPVAIEVAKDLLESSRPEIEKQLVVLNSGK